MPAPHDAPADAPARSTSGDGRRPGGLTPGGRKEIFPVFTVLLTVLAFDVLFLLMLPYLLTAGTDSPWASSGHLSFLGAAVLSGMVFGTLAAVVADRRNQSPWWFLAGHAGAFISPVVAAAGLVEQSPFSARMIIFAAGLAGTVGALLIIQATPGRNRPQPGGLSTALGRFWFQFSNIYLGIALLILFVVALHLGTWWEEKYGSRSAMAVFYTAWWFGGLLLAAAFSMLAATFRKFPWRIDQTGWIATHTALVLIVIGSFMTFWGKEEGHLQLREGEGSSRFTIDTHTRIQVERKSFTASRDTTWWPVFEAPSRFDRDSSITHPNTRFQVRAGTAAFEMAADRYYANSKLIVNKTNDGARPNLAVEMEALSPDGEVEKFDLVEQDQRRRSHRMGPLDILLHVESPGLELRSEALRGGRDARGRGDIVVKDAAGAELLRVPVEVDEGAPGADEKTGRMLASRDYPIPGTNVVLNLLLAFDHFDLGAGSEPVDVSPGIPGNPAVTFTLAEPDGVLERRTAFAYVPSFDEQASIPNHGAARQFPDLRVYYDYIPPYPLEPGQLFLIKSGAEFFFVLGLGSGERRTGPVREGVPLEMGIPLRMTPVAIYTHLNETATFDFRGHKPEFQAARFTVGDQVRWVPLGNASDPFRGPDGEEYRIRWFRPTAELGFHLALRDFHRDFYPGLREAQTYESYLFLTHPEKFPDPVGIKIDMNHPLRLDGWRLYQSRFSEATSMDGRETTILQVNRDPGLAVLYPACGLLVLALVIVFTQKPFLRALGRWMGARGWPASARFGAALLKVASTFAATLPGVFLILAMPEGAMQGIGALLVALGLAAESTIVHYAIKPRLTQPPPPPNALAAGARP